MLDAIKHLLKRASDYSDASEERCVASREALRQATALIGMSRDAIARSRDQIARLETHLAERPKVSEFGTHTGAPLGRFQRRQNALHPSRKDGNRGAIWEDRPSDRSGTSERT